MPLLILFSSGFLSLSFICLLFFMNNLFLKPFCISIVFFKFLGMGGELIFIIDVLSLAFFWSVSFISGMVFLYSFFYMEKDLNLRRFAVLVSMFVVSMFLLVFSGNFFLVLVGWDGLGVISFCLVIYYFSSQSLDSGIVTIFSNRVGDCLFLISFFYLFLFLDTSFSSPFVGKMTFFSFLVFLGAITKSAQIPFSAWLPAAMAAPTPVSSLVHSSTLVTAGIYLLLRFNYFFSFLNSSLLKVISLITMAVAGICACMEMDFKKMVALSTLSQLGMMLFTLCLESWILCFIHMIIHAFFKSMLFLSTGSTMHEMSSSQDVRSYGGSLFSYFCFLFFLLSSMSLIGFPFFIGFYSKENILLSTSFLGGLANFFIFFSACVFTTGYSLRMLAKCFFSFPKLNFLLTYEENFMFLVPSYFLFSINVFSGGFLFWLLTAETQILLTAMDFLTGIIIIFLGIFFFKSLKSIQSFTNSFSSLFFFRWLSTEMMSKSLKMNLVKEMDLSWGEVLGGAGTFWIIFKSGKFIRFFFKTGMSILFIFLLFFIVLLCL